MEPFVLQNNQQHQLLLEKWVTLDPQLTAGFTTRLAGESLAPYHSFNIGLHVGDDAQAVIHNRKKLADSIGMEFSSWVSGEQVHHNKIAIVTSEHRGRGNDSMETTIPNVDGLLTNVSNVLLTSFYADCVPLYFWDRKRHVIGLAHAGWKGTVTAIAFHMIQKMKEAYGSNTADIYCCIGPSIDDCCYEVNHVVINRVMQLWKEYQLPDKALSYVLTVSNQQDRNADEQHAYINLKEINRQIMIKAGIMASHIEISERCTGCNLDLFFSHRMENGLTGRMASWIGLRKEG